MSKSKSNNYQSTTTTTTTSLTEEIKVVVVGKFCWSKKKTENLIFLYDVLLTGDGYTGKVRIHLYWEKKQIFILFLKTTLCIVYKDGDYPQDPYVPTIFENYAG